MSILFDSSVLSILGTKSIVVTDIEPDGEGNFVRKLQVYDEPVSSLNRRPVLELVLSDTVELSLQIHTPELAF